MYYSQKGFWPSATFIFGLLLSAIFSVLLLLFLASSAPVILREASSGTLTANIIIRTLIFSLFLLILIFIGYIIMSFFPSIRVTETGVQYKTLFIRRSVPWEEMRRIENTRWPNGAKALVFIPKANNIVEMILNSTIRLYSNQTHGGIAGVAEPVVLLSDGLDHREMLLDQIQAHIKVRPEAAEGV